MCIRDSPIGANDDQIGLANELAEHLIEIKTGMRPEAIAPAAGFDPAVTTVGEREQRKFEEFAVLPEGHPFHAMSLTTLRRRRKEYKEGGVPGLLDKRATKSPTRFGRQDETVVALIAEQIEAQADEATVSFKTFYRRVERRVDAHNEKAAKPVECPSLSTVRRITLDMPEGKYAFGDANRRRSNNSSPYANLTPFYASRPGDEVQIDSTKLNCWVRNNDGTRWFRPELTIAVDVATRAVLTFRLTEKASNSTDTAELLAGILTPEPFRDGWKERLRYGYDSVPIERAVSLDQRIKRAARIPVVFPSTITIDNGKAFVSQQFFRVCEQFGISVNVARPATGHDKAVVERFFRTLDARFLEHLDGYTGRAVHMKGKTPPDARGLFTLEQLTDLFAEFLVNFHDMPHSGLHLPHADGVSVSPNDMYEFLVAAHGYLPAPASFNETIVALPFFEVEVHHYGVEHKGRTFDSAALDGIRRRKNKNNKPTGRWRFYYHGDDTRCVYFLDDEYDEVHSIPWTLDDRVSFPFSEQAWKAALDATSKTLSVEERQGDAIKHLQNICDRLAAGEGVEPSPRQKQHVKDRELAEIQPAKPKKKAPNPSAMTDEEYRRIMEEGQ